MQCIHSSGPPSVCLSVTCWCAIEKDERMELVYCVHSNQTLLIRRFVDVFEKNTLPCGETRSLPIFRPFVARRIVSSIRQSPVLIASSVYVCLQHVCGASCYLSSSAVCSVVFVPQIISRLFLAHARSKCRRRTSLPKWPVIRVSGDIKNCTLPLSLSK